MKIGLCLEVLGLPIRKALLAAAKLGVSGVQIDAVGDLAPDRLGATARRELRSLLRSHGLELSALRAPMRHGLDVASDLERRIARIAQVMTLSRELDCGLVVLEAGRVPDSPDDPRKPFLDEALRSLSAHGDRIGAMLALETGLETGESLRDYLASFDTASLRVNFDAANLLMNGFDPVEALRPLTSLISLVHAKDARSGGASRAAREVPLGEGDVDWFAILGTLSAAEYRGFVCVERDGGTNRLHDVTAGIAYLRKIMAF